MTEADGNWCFRTLCSDFTLALSLQGGCYKRASSPKLTGLHASGSGPWMLSALVRARSGPGLFLGRFRAPENIDGSIPLPPPLCASGECKVGTCRKPGKTSEDR